MDNLSNAVAAWQKNRAPTAPHEFDALVELFEVKSHVVHGLVSYNPARGWYECEAVLILEDNSYETLKIEVSTGLYRQIKRKLRSAGVKHLVGMTEQGKTRQPPPSTLPKNLFPIPV